MEQEVTFLLYNLNAFFFPNKKVDGLGSICTKPYNVSFHKV